MKKTTAFFKRKTKKEENKQETKPSLGSKPETKTGRKLGFKGLTKVISKKNKETSLLDKWINIIKVSHMYFTQKYTFLYINLYIFL